MTSSRPVSVGPPTGPSPSPFHRAELDNGVRILVRGNPTVPLVAVDCWLAVGALDETDQHAGASHFLEHMFFKGTPRFPVGELDRRVKAMGGYTNAATSMEYTHYFIVAPADHFEVALELLADHLSEPALPEDELVRERQVVKEEIRRKDDVPHGRLFTLLSSAAFGTSPYAREVLGTADTLDAISPSVMRRYWRERYTGERLVVAVSGDVAPEPVIEAVDRHLGRFPRGAGRDPWPDPPPVEPAMREATMDVGQGYLAWAFPTAGRVDIQELCALEVAVTALGAGETSRLYRRLVDELRLVTTVQMWTYPFERVGLTGIDAIFDPPNRTMVEDEIADTIDRAAREGLGEGEVRRAIATLRADFAYGNETNAAMSGTLGEYEVMYGAAERFLDVLSGIEAVTAQEASEVLARRVRSDRAVRAWVGPERA